MIAIVLDPESAPRANFRLKNGVSEEPEMNENVLANGNGPQESSVGRSARRANVSLLTVARKMTLVAVLAVSFCIALIMTISANSSRDDLVQQGEQAFLTMTQLLASNMAGGLRWNKAEGVAKAYSAFVTAEGSAIASIRTFNKKGEIVTRFDSDSLQAYELDDAVELTASADASDGVYLARTANHVVVVVPSGRDKEGNRYGTLAVAWSLSALKGRVYAATLRQAGVALAGLLSIIALLIFAFTKMLGRPLALMTDAMAKLAAGDNSIEIPDTDKRDDIGAMARTVQVFKDNAIERDWLEAEAKQAAEERKRRVEERKVMMRELADNFEASVGSVVDSVSRASGEIKSAAETMAATAEETSAQSTAVAAASEQATANVQTVATAAEEMSASITEIGAQVAQSSDITNRAVAEAESTNGAVQGLAEAAQKIGEVVNLINDIAAQTNLLALNATIEAARAGDAGKGFAVVASEVKSLATQTAKATDEIGSQITGMQGVTEDVVKAIEGIGKTITEVNGIATTIASSVEEQGAATQEIARNVQEAAKGTQTVNETIADVTTAAGETGTAASQMLSSAGELASQSDTLGQEVANFLNEVRAG